MANVTIAEYNICDFIKVLRNNIATDEPVALLNLSKEEIRVLYAGMIACAAAKGIRPEDLI